MVTQTTMIQNARSNVESLRMPLIVLPPPVMEKLQKHADDFGKGHGDNSQIVAPQPQRRDADRNAHKPRSQAAHQNGDKQQP